MTEPRRRRCISVYGKRVTVLVLLLLCCFQLCAPYAASSSGTVEGQYDVCYAADFESSAINYWYTNQLGGDVFSSVSQDSQLMVVTGDSSISGNRALRLNRCDIRWMGDPIQGKSFRMSFSIKIDNSFDQRLQLMLSTQDAATNLDTNTGALLTIENHDAGTAILSGPDQTKIATLEKDFVYSVELFFDRGSDVVRIALNGDMQALSIKFFGKIYFVDGFKWLMQKTDGQYSNGYCIIDDLFLATKRRIYAQTYSVQMEGTPVAVSVPKTDLSTDLRVFVNDIQIGISQSYISSQTVYISAEQFCKSICVSYKYDKEQKRLTIKNDQVDVRVSVPGTKAVVNGTEVDLSYPVRMIDNVVMISPNFINEVFNAKVWWDRDANMLVITTGVRKNDKFLRKIGSKLYMNGEPYYTMGYDAPNLFQTVLQAYLNGTDEARVDLSAVETLLSSWQKDGIHTLRISCDASLVSDYLYDEERMACYLQSMDAFLDLCDQYGFQVVINLDLISETFLAKEYVSHYGWLTRDEELADLVADPMSASRENMNTFIATFVSRYLNRRTILLYEIADGGNLYADTGSYYRRATYSLAQLSAFYADCVEQIRLHDAHRLISSGDASLLSYQWDLYDRVMAGDSEGVKRPVTQDEADACLQALWLLNQSVDLMCIQSGRNEVSQLNQFYLGEDPVTDFMGYAELKQLSEQFGMTLYNAYAHSVGVSGAATANETVPFSLADTLASGVQVSFWQSNDALSSDVLGESDRQLRSRYSVNMAEYENTNRIWKGSVVNVFDPDQVISFDEAAKENSTWDLLLRFCVLSAIMVVFVAFTLFLFRNKKVM